MRFAYLSVMILTLIVTATARTFNTKDASHWKALERFISGKDNADMKNHAAKRKYSTVPLQAFAFPYVKIEVNIHVYD